MSSVSNFDEHFDYQAEASFPTGDALTNRLQFEFGACWRIDNRETGEKLWAVAMPPNTQLSVKQYQLIKSCEAAGHKIIVVTPHGIIDDRSGLELEARQAEGAEQNASSKARLTLSCRPAERPTVPLDSLDRLIDGAAELARDIFDACGSVSPVWLLLKNGDLEFVEAEGDVQDKDFLAESLRQLFKTRGAERYVSIDERWSSASPSDGIDGPISSHPDRSEHVWIYAEDKIDWRAAKLRIVRPKRKKPRLGAIKKLGPPRYGTGGRFTGLLRERETSEDSSLVNVRLSPVPDQIASATETERLPDA
jgi:hypothetical protein